MGIDDVSNILILAIIAQGFNISGFVGVPKRFRSGFTVPEHDVHPVGSTTASVVACSQSATRLPGIDGKVTKLREETVLHSWKVPRGQKHKYSSS